MSRYIQKLQLSLGPDSYFHYKRERKYEQKEAEHAREHAKDVAQRERKGAVRRRKDKVREGEYAERYTREHERDVAPERTGRAEEIEPER